MGLFDIFKTPVHEKYKELIHALREHYQSLCITKVESSIFSMCTNHYNNIDNLIITIFKGKAYDGQPVEYSNLFYDNYIFVKMTYIVNKESVTIHNAFPKSGNQYLMFLSIIGAEMAKTNHILKNI